MKAIFVVALLALVTLAMANNGRGHAYAVGQQGSETEPETAADPVNFEDDEASVEPLEDDSQEEPLEDDSQEEPLEDDADELLGKRTKAPTAAPTTTTAAPTTTTAAPAPTTTTTTAAPAPTTTTAAPTADPCQVTVSTGNNVLTAAQINAILKAHNDARKLVSPGATAMPLLRWNVNLATFAQNWVNQCPSTFAHSTSTQRQNVAGFAYIGENLAWGTGSGMMPTYGGGSFATGLWNNERQYWSYSTGCNTGSVCGHYTQNIWSRTTDVGCGYALCGTTHRWSCNYGPGGNYVGQQPYTAGTPPAGCQLPQ